MKARWKVLIVVGVFMLASMGAWLATTHIGPENEVEAYKTTLRTRGEKLEISEVMPPSVAPESNAVDLVEQAFNLLAPDYSEDNNLPPAMRMVAPGKAMASSQQVEVRDEDLTNSWENVLTAREASRPITELLIQAATYPEIGFHIDYQAGPDISFWHLAPFKRCAQRLSASTVCDLHNGDVASAVTNLCALLALAQADHDERIFISQLVRMAIAAITATSNWELLQSTNVTDSELARLQKSWEQMEFISSLENSLLMERAITEAQIKKMRASQVVLNRYTGGVGTSGGSGSGDWLDSVKDYWHHTTYTASVFMWRTSWSYSDELRALKADQIVLDTVRTISTNQIFNPACTSMFSHLGTAGITNVLDGWLIKMDFPDFRWIFSDQTEVLATAVRRCMAAETCKRVLITAIALKRFELRHGHYPEKLPELVPEFLATAPLDPADGKPLRYHPNSDRSYLLYSIGPDGVDDGGNPSLSSSGSNPSLYWLNLKARDWVWPQPATPAEIQYYYDHPPK